MGFGWIYRLHSPASRNAGDGGPAPSSGVTRGIKETTFQVEPAVESVDTHTIGPMYLLYDLNPQSLHFCQVPVCRIIENWSSVISDLAVNQGAAPFLHIRVVLECLCLCFSR